MSLRFRDHSGWGTVTDETRWMKIVEGLNCQAREFDLYSLGSGKPLKVLPQDSDVRPVFQKDYSSGNVDDRWERLG